MSWDGCAASGGAGEAANGYGLPGEWINRSSFRPAEWPASLHTAFGVLREIRLFPIRPSQLLGNDPLGFAAARCWCSRPEWFYPTHAHVVDRGRILNSKVSRHPSSRLILRAGLRRALRISCSTPKTLTAAIETELPKCLMGDTRPNG
jgi:hypothetical protein